MDQENTETPVDKAAQRKLLLSNHEGITTAISTFHKGEVARFDSQLTQLLAALDLPSKGILAETHERAAVFVNLPAVLDHLPPDRRNEADYIAKFVAAAAVGLFDAALSYIWDATIANLRDRVANFDVTYFYDVLFTDPTQRSNYKAIEDLAKVEDWQLISGCREIGLIDDLGYKHLSFIRDMRNYGSAAHPTTGTIDGLSLASWLQACIRYVLALPLDEVSIRIKKLLANIRTTVLRPGDESATVAALPRTPDEQADSLLKAIFGIYIDPQSSAQAKTNVELFAVPVWKRASEEARRAVGQKYYLLSADAEVIKKEAAKLFLQKVDGLAYIPESARAAELSSVLDDLRKAHNAWGNYYNEPPHAKALTGYVPQNGSVPTSVVRKYVRTVVLCRCGNTFGYSWGAATYLDPLLARFTDAQIQEFVVCLEDNDVEAELRSQAPVSILKNIATDLSKRTTNAKLQNALNFIIGSSIDDYRSGKVRQEIAAIMRI